MATRTNKRMGNVTISTYNKTKTRKNLMGGKTIKTTKAEVMTDLDSKMTMASGSKTKVRTNRMGNVVSSRTKKLSPRKIIKRGY